MNPATVTELEHEVVGVFQQVTRYPREIIAPDVSLEDDLGIDSVKLGEIFSVLRDRYDLPPKLDLPRERLRTIAAISAALHELLVARGAAPGVPSGVPAVGTSPAPAPDPEPGPPAPRRNGAAIEPPTGSSSAAWGGDGVLTRARVRERVLETFAEVTRYPREILTFDANLEDDLGIDSVKLGEIFSVLRTRYQLPDKIDVQPDELKTIGGLAEAFHRYLSSVAAPAAGRARDHGNGAGDHHPGNGHHGAVASSFAALTPARKPFAGKVAFITGSGRGLGRDLAIYLAELGAQVIVNSFHSRSLGEATTAEIQASGGDAMHLWGSVAHPAQLDAMFDQIEHTYGGLDFFISNASNGMLAPIEELTTEHWERAFRTNVVGLHQGAVRAARLMKRRGGGKIITLSSPAAHGYVDHFGCMGAVKAAVESLTKALAIELARYNIQVNCVSPGPIVGELLRKWPDSERLVAEWTRATPYERLCEHRDVSHFVAYLLSEPVKLFTGAVLVLDGGISSRGWG